MPLSSVVGAQSIIRPGVCTSSTRPASPYDGQVIYETDTDKTLVWNGTGWVFLSTSRANAVGLDFITSTTVTASNTITIDGCFTSAYTNYRMIFTGKHSADQNAFWQLRVGGVSATAANYDSQYTQSSGGSMFAGRSSGQTTGRGWACDTAEGQMAVMDITNPAVATPTSFVYQGVYMSGSNIVHNFNAARHSLSTAYDGIIFTVQGSATATGTLSIFGYAK